MERTVSTATARWLTCVCSKLAALCATLLRLANLCAESVVHAGLWMLVMRRGAAGVQLYDALQLDRSPPAVRAFKMPEPTSFFSDAAFSATGEHIAASGSCGGTYLFQVRLYKSTGNDNMARLATAVQCYGGKAAAQHSWICQSWLWAAASTLNIKPNATP
jgi:hypothetical protein